MRKKIIVTLGLAVSLFGLSACSSSNNDGNNDGDDTQQPSETLSVEFEYEASHLTIEKQDNIDKKVEGDNFKFTLTINEGVKINSIKANGKECTSLGSSTYVFSLINGKNIVKIDSISTILPFKAEKMEINPAHTSGTLYKNRGYPHFPSTGNQKLLVVPVELKGHEKYATEANKEKIEKAFFGDSKTTYFESVSSYYKKSSYGKLNITGTVTDWFRPGLTDREIFEMSDDKFTDYGIFELSNRAVKWVQESCPNINLDEYDNNDDGFVDGIYFVYGALDALSDLSLDPELATLRWNHTFYNIDNSNRPGTKEKPVAMTYSWSSFNMMNRVSPKDIDAHTFIHEFGHQLGLDDYYDTGIQSGSAYTSPMGGLDMMDYNIGDHSMYSKYALGWTAPTKISGNSGSVTVTLKPSYKDGDFIIIPGDAYNGLPFDEYIAIEYLSNENNPSNLNYFDSQNPYPVTATNDGKLVSTFGQSGIRVTHIDARGVDANNKFTNNIDEIVRTKFSNTGKTNDGYRDPITNNNYVLSTLISANTSRNVQGVLFTADSSDLFKEKESFNFKKNTTNSYVNCLPSLDNKLNNGSKMNYEVNILSLTKDEAKVEIKAL